jgi:Uma2 family endonuclease
MVTTKRITVEDLERDGVPEGRWELIAGELVEMVPSGGEASTRGMWIGTLLSNHVVPSGLGRVYGADGGFVLYPGQSNEMIRVPDVAFVVAERVPPPPEHARFLRLAPDLAVEVVSPSDRPAEVTEKAAMWLAAGVRLLWVVDPRARTVAVHVPDQAVRVLGVGEELEGGDVLPGFRVAVTELFR